MIFESNLPAGFLALRREALVIAADREFRNSTEPIPEIPAIPGIYTPPVKATILCAPTKPLRPLLGHKESNRLWRERKRAREGRGSVPTGSKVEAARGIGLVLGYVAAGEDPMAFVPAGTPLWRITGARTHGPSHIPRYALAVLIGDQLHYLFPKAATLEREFKAMRAAS